LTPQLRHPRHPAFTASLANFDQSRWSSNANPQRKGFLGNLIENVKEELEKNKELQVSLFTSAFLDRSSNESEALKDARRKFVSCLLCTSQQLLV
ncbi:hypothetical protein ANCDUO_19359, partial [Ancylostoma duodenale]